MQWKTSHFNNLFGNFKEKFSIADFEHIFVSFDNFKEKFSIADFEHIFVLFENFKEKFFIAYFVCIDICIVLKISRSFPLHILSAYIFVLF
jgi:hypothetical protein